LADKRVCIVLRKHTVIVISHDRGLLNRAVGSILHLEDRKLTLYSGGYDSFARIRAERRALQAAEAKKQEVELAGAVTEKDRLVIETELKVKEAFARALGQGIGTAKLPAVVLFNGGTADAAKGGTSMFDQLMQLMTVEKAAELSKKVAQ
jgi:ATPase subunit of ABC transporter with duplicated ATPase domains